MTEIKEVLERYYHNYFLRHYRLNERSAITIKAALWIINFLQELYEERGSLKVAELGSGFSSLAIRHWHKHHAPDAIVHTTDHNPLFLTLTKASLQVENLPVENVWMHDEWKYLGSSYDYDFMFSDLGGGYRDREFHNYISRLKDEGVFVLDDWHMEEERNRSVYYPMLKKEGFEIYPMPENKDRFGRYMAYAKKEE